MESNKSSFSFFVKDVFISLKNPFVKLMNLSILIVTFFKFSSSSLQFKITKVLLCFNISFVMYYSVVARSYSLVMFLIIWLATIYRKRRERPYLYGLIMALLVNTHVLTCGLVGSLLLIDFIDIVIKKNRDNVRRRLYGIGITLVGILLLFLRKIL